MATADKLTYLNETKSQIKSMINYGLETPLTNEPFRDYVSSIFKAFIQSLNNPDTLWNNLPKITGTGTNISLNNTIEAPMKIELSPVELSQAGTPTPSSPQAVHTISGDNKIKVEGGNLFKSTLDMLKTNNPSATWSGNQATINGVVFTYNDDGSITATGQASANTYLYLTRLGSQYDAFNIPSGTYYLTSHETTGGNNSWKLQFSIGTTYNVFGTGNNKEQTCTINDNTGVYASIIVYSGYNPSGAKFYPMIAKTSNATYTPYKGTDYSIDLDTIEYCKIGNYKDRIFKNVSGDTDYSNTREDGAWYIKKNIIKVKIDGSESWRGGDPGINSTDYRYMYTTKPQSISTDVANIICDHFQIAIVYASATVSTSVIGTATANNDNLRVLIDKTLINNPADSTEAINNWKTWLSNNNTLIYYVLATPTYTKITGTLAEQLEAIKYSKDGQTNISQVNNDLAFGLSVQAIEDLSV